MFGSAQPNPPLAPEPRPGHWHCPCWAVLLLVWGSVEVPSVDPAVPNFAFILLIICCAEFCAFWRLEASPPSLWKSVTRPPLLTAFAWTGDRFSFLLRTLRPDPSLSPPGSVPVSLRGSLSITSSSLFACRYPRPRGRKGEPRALSKSVAKDRRMKARISCVNLINEDEEMKGCRLLCCARRTRRRERMQQPQGHKKECEQQGKLCLPVSLRCLEMRDGLSGR